jgi:hypothetical protein
MLEVDRSVLTAGFASVVTGCLSRSGCGTGTGWDRTGAIAATAGGLSARIAGGLADTLPLTGDETTTG